MLIQLLPVDIPRYWEPIKHAAVAVDEVDVKQRPAYLRDLLQNLMSSSAQAWLRVDESREIASVCITRILHNSQFDEKYLYVQVTYSWKRVPESVWGDDIETLKEFGKKEGCKYIGCMSRNPRIWEIVQRDGFKETTRIFALRLD